MARQFHLLGGFACGNLSSVYRRKTTIPFEYGVIGTADFVKK
jgi:hypothetical protein